MERDAFHARFLEAATHARDFARRLVEEPIPDEMRFRLRLNCSYDGNPLHADEVVFPEDSSERKQIKLVELSAIEVVDALWRDGRVPEWINLTVVGETGTAALVGVDACGRFTSNERLFYHQREGLPPFHVLGPHLPVGWQEGDRFSLYRDFYCSSLQALGQAANHAHKVGALELAGHSFTDTLLSELPHFPNLEVLGLQWSPLSGPGLSGLSNLPSLRALRGTALRAQRIDLSSMPPVRQLTELSLSGNLRELVGVAQLISAAPKLDRLTLNVVEEVEIDSALPPLQYFSISAVKAPRFKMPDARELSIHIRRGTDSDVLDVMEGSDRLEALWLENTPVTDRFLAELDRWKNLKFLDVARTRVTRAAVGELSLRRPSLKVLPAIREKAAPAPAPAAKQGLLDRILSRIGGPRK